MSNPKAERMAEAIARLIQESTGDVDRNLIEVERNVITLEGNHDVNYIVTVSTMFRDTSNDPLPEV